MLPIVPGRLQAPVLAQIDLCPVLRERGGEGLELSQYRFTRVVKLFDRVHKLAGQPRYGRFFAQADAELAEIDAILSA